MLVPDGAPKVLDFGLAKAVESSQRSDTGPPAVTSLAMTRDGAVLGTTPYMSPEQSRRPPRRSEDRHLGVGVRAL